MPNTSATGGYLLPTNPNPASGFILDRRLNEIISGTTGIPGSLVRPRWQPEPPPRPAANIDWVGFGKLREDRQTASPYIQHDPDGDGGNGLDRLYHKGNVHYLASFYGPNSEQMAQLLIDGLEILQNHEVIAPLGLNLKQIGDPIFIPEQINQIWYMRTDVELIFEQSYVREYAVQNILHADGEVHTQRPGLDEDGNPVTVDVDWNTDNVVP